MSVDLNHDLWNISLDFQCFQWDLENDDSVLTPKQWTAFEWCDVTEFEVVVLAFVILTVYILQGYSTTLTHCGLEMPYSNGDLGQHWSR